MSFCMELEVVADLKLWNRYFCWKQNVTFFSFTDCLWRQIKCHCASWSLLVTHVNQKDISLSGRLKSKQPAVDHTTPTPQKKILCFSYITKLLGCWVKKGSQEVKKKKKKKIFQLTSTSYRLLNACVRDKFYPICAWALAPYSCISYWGLIVWLLLVKT